MGDRPLHLVVLHSNDRALAGATWAVDTFPAVVTIGRDPACTLAIRSDTVSRHHARLEQRADGWYVVDDASTSGTYVNDLRVREALVRPGDRIQIGGTILSLT